MYELVMAKNKSDRLHNKSCHHKGQYNVTFSCTKGLSIQPKSAWQPLFPSVKGISFTFIYLLSCKSQSFSLYSFLCFTFGKHHVVRKDLGTYIQLDMGNMSYYCCSDQTSNSLISMHQCHPWISNADTHST